jgi:hypothetical protein
MKKLLTISGVLLTLFAEAQTIVAPAASSNTFRLDNVHICYDAKDQQLIQTSARLLQKDLQAVTGKEPVLATSLPKNPGTAIIIGTIEQSSLIQSLVKSGKIKTAGIKGKWEAYTIQSVNNPVNGIANAIVIAGADRRGAAYGVFELSRQLGVSPWYWWADVPVKKQENIFIRKNITITDSPQVKYRGIFINDEAPALSGWSREKFGGFNSKFYEKVFELILRHKGNYLWPAMWGNAFYDDDSLNIKMADKYGVVIGTSHHEPLMRAHDEWRRYGKGLWNYDSNKVKLREFWRGGMQRATNEKIVSVGMRGDGDAPMSRETATTLLENIVKDQREIIAEVTGKDPSETPQLWALYKEVQDYYDKGMRVPGDVTLLLCDDNWGNIRKLPRLDEKPRKGGYGIYYHFDYVGGPRNYKWVNTNPLPRIWEQMHLAWAYKARQIWIVNVGDIKPMEFPISFFLDYAWNPGRIQADQLQAYTETWAAAQFGDRHAKDIADILAKYAKYNSRRKPELLDANTFSTTNAEYYSVMQEYKDLLKKAEAIDSQLPAAYKDAYFQLVLHPVKACANLYEMYFNVAMNKEAYANKWAAANTYADKVKELYANDSLITVAYHQLNNGKWNHMMSQTHIGYTYWQQPNRQKMPDVKYLPADSAVEKKRPEAGHSLVSKPYGCTGNCFFEDGERGVSIEAFHFTKAVNSRGITWKVLPDHGRTGSAITPFPVTAAEQKPGGDAPHVEYVFTNFSTGEFTINAYFSPSLNYFNTGEGLQFAISVDDETPQIVSINKEDKNTGTGIWNKWVAENIIIKSTKHNISTQGQHTVKYWMVNPGVVLQKLVLDFGRTEKTYLGPTETLYKLN